MDKEKHCVTCKTIKDLMPKPYAKYKNKQGVVTSVGYMCRRCNVLRQAKYRSTRKGKEAIRRADDAEKLKNPEKVEARRLLRYAVRKGRISKPDYCSSCHFKTNPDGHHPDYSKPYDVLWLCKTCHIKLHNAIKM